jgi:hypothetical protein
LDLLRTPSGMDRRDPDETGAPECEARPLGGKGGCVMAERRCSLHFRKPGGPNLCIGSDDMTPDFAHTMCVWLKDSGIEMTAQFRWANETVRMPDGREGTMTEEFIVDIDGRRDRGRSGQFDFRSNGNDANVLGTADPYGLGGA